MERRGRVRENPELKLGETLKRSNSKSSTSQEGCAGRAARPLPAAALLAMVIATGNGVLVVAFAPAFVPLDWVAIARGGRPNAGEVRGGSHGSWWTQAAAGGGVVGDGDGGGGVARGRRRRGRRESGFLRSGQTWLSGTRSNGETDPGEASIRADGTPNQQINLPESSRDRGYQNRNKGRKAAGGSTGRYGRVGGRAGGRRKEQGGKLAQLVMIDTGFEEPPIPAATNKTELSQKVEAELFGEYDVMVPGPAASLVAVGTEKDETDGVQERTGRPLTINLDLLSYHARQKALSGNHTEARALYRRCVELDPRDGRGWLGLARQMQKINKLDKAQLLFEAGLDNCPDNPFLLQAFAVMEEERGNEAKALTLLNRSVRLNPAHTASWVALGLLNERNRRINEARGCFEKATKSDSRNYYAWLVWGMLEKRFGSVDVAREKFKTCVRVNPKNAKTYQAWGVLESEEGNFSLAAELFKAGLQQRSDNTFIMQAWALMETKRGDTAQAISLFKKALITRPRDGAVWQAYALLMRDTGDIAGARALFKQGVRQAPKHCPTWQAWGMMEWQLGDVQNARKLFQDGIWESPKGPSVVRILQAWAILEASEGNFDDSRKYFGFALARDPYSLPVMVAWGLMEESLGDIGRARQLFEIAATTEPSNPNIWEVYEQAEARGGFPAEATAVHGRGVLAISSASQMGNSSPNAWWDKGVVPRELLEPRSESLIDQASRSLTTSSAEMALRVSRIIGGVQWASDYMTFCAINTSRAGGEVAFEQ